MPDRKLPPPPVPDQAIDLFGDDGDEATQISPAHLPARPPAAPPPGPMPGGISLDDDDDRTVIEKKPGPR